MNDIGNNKPVTVKESDKLTTFNSLPGHGPVPNGRMVTDGDLTLVQQVLYNGKKGSNLNYTYHSFIEWSNPPVSQKTDSLASAWDDKAVAIDSTFRSQWYAVQPIVGGFIEDSGKIDPDPDAFQTYGNGIKKEVEYGQTYQVTMDRDVAVNDDYIGHRANIITKHHHTYLTLKGVGINIGPATVSFNSTWGDTIVVEYGYNYGDK